MVKGLVFSRPLHGLQIHADSLPAMNRWAIISRPLTRTRYGEDLAVTDLMTRAQPHRRRQGGSLLSEACVNRRKAWIALP